MISLLLRILFFCLLSIPCVAQFKLYEKGHDFYTAGKYNDAITNFTQYLSKPTRDKALDVEVYYLRALSYYKTHDYKNAIADFEETILLDHINKGNIYWFMAKGHEHLGETKDAIEAYTSALRELNTNKDAKSKLFAERGLLRAKMGQANLAYEDLKTSHTLNPSNHDVKRELDKIEKHVLAGAKHEKKDGANAGQDATHSPTVAQPAVAANTSSKDVVSQPKKDEIPVAAEQTSTSTTIVASGSQAGAVANSLADFYKDEKRFALVIGNSNYPKSIGVLKNPVNDATDFAKELELSNFEVQLLTNATYGQMRAAMLKFKERVDASERDKTVALFYFAGHGLQHEDENYLVPVDATIEYEDDIARYCFAVQRMVLANMERSNSRMNIVILDACRNNPFPALTRSAGQQGLGEMRRARGSFMAFATAPGSVASDGTGRNGLYTQELIKAVRKPGLTIEQVFKEVRANVLRLSGNRQNTWDSSNIVGEFYFRF